MAPPTPQDPAPEDTAAAAEATGPDYAGWVFAVAVVVACTAAGMLLEDLLDLVDLIMIQLAGVVLVALRQSPRVAAASVVATVLLFDLVIVPPRWSLNPLNPRHMVTLAVMLAVGLLISRLVAQANRQARQRAASEQRRAQAAMQAETEKLRNTLLAGVSHDLRTPLATIIGSASTLLDQAPRIDAEQREALTRAILDQARRLHHQVSDLLELTRLEDESVRAQPEWCPADDLVHEALAPLRAAAASHRLETQVPPDALLWCDPRLVAQAVANLVDNALRHTPPGTQVRVSVGLGGPLYLAGAAPSTTPSTTPFTTPPTGADEHTSWWLEVADNGPGLSADSQAHAFRKFHHGRGEPAGTAGTGLGLALCQAIARLHHGRIELLPGPGACFRMTLPQPPLGAALSSPSPEDA